MAVGQVQQHIAREYEQVNGITHTLSLFRAGDHDSRPIGEWWVTDIDGGDCRGQGGGRKMVISGVQFIAVLVLEGLRETFLGIQLLWF